MLELRQVGISRGTGSLKDKIVEAATAVGSTTAVTAVSASAVGRRIVRAAECLSIKRRRAVRLQRKEGKASLEEA